MAISHKLIISALAMLTAACGPNPGVLRDGRPTPQEPGANVSSPRPSSLDQDISDMRDADYTFIYVIRRKDGRPIEAEDRAVLRTAFEQANRRIISDEARALLIGANSAIPSDKLAPIYDRFTVTTAGESSTPPPNSEQ